MSASMALRSCTLGAMPGQCARQQMMETTSVPSQRCQNGAACIKDFVCSSQGKGKHRRMRKMRGQSFQQLPIRLAAAVGRAKSDLRVRASSDSNVEPPAWELKAEVPKVRGLSHLSM